MGYILKNSTQGAIVARLTDAGREKLSQGKLNIALFQLGDSELCYNCYTQLPASYGGTNILQAEHNAQNILAKPAKNSGHVKYPILGGINTGDTFGPTIPQHAKEDVFNTATARGFFSVPPGNLNGVLGEYTYYSAQTSGLYTESSNWNICYSALTGGSQACIYSANTCQSTNNYSPRYGDMISITYEFGDTNPCQELNYSSASQTLFYQVLGGNGNAAQTSTTLNLTLDRDLPTMPTNAVLSSACTRVRVYPAFSANPMSTTSIYTSADTSAYWCDDSLSFNSCCNVSTTDTKIWNMNINWSESIAGVGAGDANVDTYGSSGYCGSKEYFGYRSNNGQTFTDQRSDAYHPNTIGGTWYYDSNDSIRVVLPEAQKCLGLLHYTNNTTTDFYGEKFALELNTVTDIGEAKNFKLHLPWLMWHKKDINGSGTGSGLGNEEILGQTFYVDPPTNSIFAANPHYMLSSKNINMNDDGLRYYHLTDDNVGNGVIPNIVGKVFPDYKLVAIQDEELLAAMSYKSNRSYTLPAPKIEKVAPGSGCVTGCTGGAMQINGQTLWVTYMFSNGAGMTTGMHCNYYVHENKSISDPFNFDVAVSFGPEFPYLRPFNDTTYGLGTGWEADEFHILWQQQPTGTRPSPSGWKGRNYTGLIVGHTVGNKITASAMTNNSFYVTENEINNSCAGYIADVSGYTVPTSLNIPNNTTDPQTELQFGDEYFFYGTLQTDIMATIYEMKHVIQLGNTQYNTSTNPTWVDYSNANPSITLKPKITEIGLFDNENGFPDLMAIAKLQSPVERSGTQQFAISIDF